MKTLIFLLVCGTVNSVPLKEISHNELGSTEGSEEKNEVASTSDINVTDNDLNAESRAGIIDDLNPFNKKPNQAPTSNNNDDGQNSNNPLEAIQNFFSNAPQLFNGSNPFEQLFSSQPGGNFLDNVKVFLVGSQGVVMPASAILGGFQNMMQALGNFVQQPSLPAGK